MTNSSFRPTVIILFRSSRVKFVFMGNAEMVLQYIKVTIYPALIALAIILFKREIQALSSGKLTAKYKDLEVTLERQQKSIHNLRESQENALAIVKRNVEEMTPHAEPSSTFQPPVFKSVIESLLGNPDSMESRVINYLRKHDGSASQFDVIFKLRTETDEPWHGDRDAQEALDAINDLVKRHIVARNINNLVLHPSLIESR